MKTELKRIMHKGVSFSYCRRYLVENRDVSIYVLINQDKRIIFILEYMMTMTTELFVAPDGYSIEDFLESFIQKNNWRKEYVYRLY